MSTPLFTAGLLREWGVDTLAAHLLCRLRETPDDSVYPELLARWIAAAGSDAELRRVMVEAADVAAVYEPLPAALDALTRSWCGSQGDDQALLAGWRAETARRIGDAPYRLGSPTLQLPVPASRALTVLALLLAARRAMADQPVIPDLVAAPQTPAGAPTFGTGRDVFIVGDPEDQKLPALLDTAADLLGERSAGLRWVWLHAPRVETPQAVAQAIQRQVLLDGKPAMDLRRLAELLRVQGTPYVPWLKDYPDDPRVPQVLQPLWMLDACGAPRSRRPALVVGRSIHIGALDDAFVSAVLALTTADGGE